MAEMGQQRSPCLRLARIAGGDEEIATEITAVSPWDEPP
jgi:hypothetical protein